MSPEWRGAEEEEARDEAAGPDEEIEQVLAREEVLCAAGFGEFEEVQVPVPAPVDDVVAAVFLDLRLQPLARDAVREEVGDDAALRIDFLFKEPAQDPPLQPRRQRARPRASAKTNSTRRHSSLPRASGCVAGAAMSWTTRTRRLRSPSVGWSAAARAISHGTRASAAAR